MHTPHSVRHDRMKYGDIKLYAGTSCPELATRVATHMGLDLCDREIIQFPNENLFLQLHSSVRGQDCYVIQTTSAPVHRNLMELLILLQTLRLDSACACHRGCALPVLRAVRQERPATHSHHGASGSRLDRGGWRRSLHVPRPARGTDSGLLLRAG